MSGRHQATAPKFSQMRVSEGRGHLCTMPSVSILDKTKFCQFSIRTHTLASYPRRKDAVLGIGFVGCKEKITILQNISDKKTITQKR